MKERGGAQPVGRRRPAKLEPGQPMQLGIKRGEERGSRLRDRLLSAAPKSAEIGFALRISEAMGQQSVRFPDTLSTRNHAR